MDELDRLTAQGTEIRACVDRAAEAAEGLARAANGTSCGTFLRRSVMTCWET